jgi:hypothetical protein
MRIRNAIAILLLAASLPVMAATSSDIDDPGASPRIFSWTYGTDTTFGYPNLIASIKAFLPNAQITGSKTFDTAEFYSLLAGVNVLMIPGQENVSPPAQFGSMISSRLDAFVRNGGIVIALLPSLSQAFIPAAGLDTMGPNPVYTTSSYAVTVDNPALPVFNNVMPLSLRTLRKTSYWSSISGATVLASFTEPIFSSHVAVCSERLKGAGFIYLLGYNFQSVDTTTWGKILFNCIERSASTSSNPGNRRSLPSVFSLQAYDAGGMLRIMCAVPQRLTASSQDVAIDLFDLRGALVRRIHRGALVPGYYQFPVSESELASGVYCCRLRSAVIQKLAPVYVKK